MKNKESQKKEISKLSIIQLYIHTNLISLLFQIELDSFFKLIFQKKKSSNPPILQILSHIKIKIPPGLYSWRFAIRFAKVIHLRDRIPLQDPIRLAVIPEPVKVSERRLKISSRYWPVFRIFLELRHETVCRIKEEKNRGQLLEALVHLSQQLTSDKSKRTIGTS